MTADASVPFPLSRKAHPKLAGAVVRPYLCDASRRKVNREEETLQERNADGSSIATTILTKGRNCCTCTEQTAVSMYTCSDTKRSFDGKWPSGL